MEAESLDKTIPPKLYYRLRRFFLMNHPEAINNPKAISAVNHAVQEKAEEILALRNLQKNELMASVYDSGSVKLDFGSGVPEPVKKAAMAWAKRKGLKPVEASLSKSANSSSSMIFSDGMYTPGRCMQRVKWTVE
jgi:hypothetical protein